jgi:hypothetical protein
MAARVPLDVDLEDKLLYGLTPMRLGYLVVGLLLAISVWSGNWAPPPVRGGTALIIGIAGATAAWGHWRGRAVDSWFLDMLRFVAATYRIRRMRRTQ